MKADAGHIGKKVKGRLKWQRTRALRHDWHRKRFKLQNGICVICGTPMHKPGPAARENLVSTLDHIIPLSKGGSDHWENTQAVHNKCNSAKADSVDVELLKELSDDGTQDSD